MEPEPGDPNYNSFHGIDGESEEWSGEEGGWAMGLGAVGQGLQGSEGYFVRRSGGAGSTRRQTLQIDVETASRLLLLGDDTVRDLLALNTEKGRDKRRGGKEPQEGERGNKRDKRGRGTPFLWPKGVRHTCNLSKQLLELVQLHEGDEGMTPEKSLGGEALVELFQEGDCGLGVRVREGKTIPKKTFLFPYLGELAFPALLTEKEKNYSVYLPKGSSKVDLVICAYQQGSMARFINHSPEDSANIAFIPHPFRINPTQILYIPIARTKRELSGGEALRVNYHGQHSTTSLTSNELFPPTHPTPCQRCRSDLETGCSFCSSCGLQVSCYPSRLTTPESAKMEMLIEVSCALNPEDRFSEDKLNSAINREADKWWAAYEFPPWPTEEKQTHRSSTDVITSMAGKWKEGGMTLSQYQLDAVGRAMDILENPKLRSGFIVQDCGMGKTGELFCLLSPLSLAPLLLM